MPVNKQPTSTQRWIWIAVAGVLFACGVATAVLGAHVVLRNDRQSARAAFRASGAEVASKLNLAIQREEDLVVSARAYLVGSPNSSEAAFRRWSRSVEAFARYPELEGGGEVVVVPNSGLAAFAARQTADHSGQARPGGSFAVLPPGPRPFYCLVALTIERRVSPATATPAGLDYCATATDLRSTFLTARDTGHNGYLPYRGGPTAVLLVQSPVYRGGVVPGTVAGRRHAFLGAFGATFIPRVVLETALRGHPGMGVEVRYGSVYSHVVFRSGRIERGAAAVTIVLGYGWTMHAFGAPVAVGILTDSEALTLLVGGLALSALLGLLVFVLGTSRARAFAMVAEKTREISHQSLHDALTGLPNRALVLDRAGRMLARARRDPAIVPAALFIDVDRFKYVNDTYGHAGGDRLLCTIAERLRAVVRDQDTVGRLGGDEFVVLLESATRESPPEGVAERVIESLRRPIALTDGERPFTATVSVGIATGQRPTADELLRDADLALYTAKAAGKDRAVCFQSSMQSVAENRRQLDRDLDTAIEQDQFFLLYQPIIDLDSGHPVAVEALIRWRHPQRGVVEPDDFIPLAEETGRIVSIGRWVLDEACRQAGVWAAAGRPMGMSVNVSAFQLDRDGFAEDVRRALEASAIEPSSLTLEITETALMRDVAAASERLRDIKALGVRVAVDDFGTGSSSLAYLRHFEADCLKIDRSFIAEMTGSGESAAIIHTLVELGKALGIDTLAEGIEQPEQLAQLQHERCVHGQGFLFARPLDVDGVERLLAQRRTAPATTA